MPRFTPPALLTSLETWLARPTGAALCVAYSGGLDSTVLLHAIARIASGDSRYRLRAVHVDHQLNPDSARWSEHCERVTRTLQVELVRLTVEVSHDADKGLEASARDARYGALRALLQPDEILLTAQHADDQLETVLLALMRGAGVRGLSAMPPIQRFGAGWLARPLLEFTRADLETWADGEQLQWICDPSNQNLDQDRNYLRHRVSAVLRERWPAAAQTARRSAEHLAEAGHLLDSLAAADMASVTVGSCLDSARLRRLEPPRRRNVLRHWIKQCGGRSPSTRQLAAIEHDMLMAADDRSPCIGWGGDEVRRHRGLLYCVRRQPLLSASDGIEWDGSRPIELPATLGRLTLLHDPAGGISASMLSRPLRIRFRAGGESLRPSGDAHHRKLKKLLQSSRVLPWWRDRLPLIYSGKRLLAVGDLWIAEEFATRGEAAVRIVWEGKPEMEAEMRVTG